MDSGAKRTASNANSRGRHILIVDDDFEFRVSARDLLCNEGYAVSEARNGEEAIAHVRLGEPPALILLDLQMPVMDGWEFCTVRRTDQVLAAIPVIIVSGFGGASRERPYAGVAAVVSKPMEPELLLDVVRRHGARPITGPRKRVT